MATLIKTAWAFLKINESPNSPCFSSFPLTVYADGMDAAVAPVMRRTKALMDVEALMLNSWASEVSVSLLVL